MRCNNCFLEISDENSPCPHCGYVKGQPAAELYHLYPGTILNNRYIIGQVLGFGGFGITYKAWDQKLETTVAIKEHYPSGLVNRVPGEKTVVLFARGRLDEYNHGLTRFLDEAKNMAKFKDHKNIVSIFEYFEENNTAYIVMEFLDGITLNEFLKTNELDSDSCLEIIHNVCNALSEIHKYNIIHRDISPDNIFLCLNGDVKLIDFGAARFSVTEEQKMTIVLKPGFAPPEQYDSINSQGPWTDIYALGATLYLMMTRTKPEESTNRKIEDTVVPPNSLNPEISEQVSNAIMKAIALDRHFRFSNISEFEKALYGEIKVVPLEKEKKNKKRKRFLGIAAAVLVLSISSIALFSGINKQKADATLPEAQISLFYEETGESAIDTAKKAALSEIVADFTEAYETVSIELIGYDESEYVTSIENAINAGKVVLFESTSLSDNSLDRLSYTIDIMNLQTQHHYGLRQYFGKNTTVKKIPLGFTLPILYINKSSSQDDYEKTLSIKEAESTFDNIVYDNGIANLINTNSSNVTEPYAGFINGEYSVLCGSSSKYTTLRNQMPGRYMLAFISPDDASCGFTDFYSLSLNAGKDEVKVAERIVEYLLSDSAQECLYIQNGLLAFPVNKNAMTVYSNVYDEFSELKEIEKYNFVN